jgi:hypothetical protein
VDAMWRIGPTLIVVVAVVSGALVATTAPAQTQGDTQSVSGVVVSLAGDTATIATSAGPVDVTLARDTTYEQEGSGTLANLQPGQYIAVTGQPTGDGQRAVQIRIFPAVQRSVPERVNSPMGGAALGNLMTNATIDSLVDNRLTVRTAGETVVVALAPDTEVLRPVPATAADLAEGRRVVVTAVSGPAGVLQARTVNLVGEPPQLLP